MKKIKMIRKNEEEKKKYGKIVEYVVSNLNGEKERTAAMRLLSSEKGLETYEILRNNDIPYATIKRIMAHSLNNFQKGKGLTIGSYASGMAEELTNSENYGDVVDEMHKDGIIGQKQYQNLQESIGEHIKGRSEELKRGLSGLEKFINSKRIAAAILGISGVGLLIMFGNGITGGVIGVANSNETIATALGGMFIVSALVLFFKKF